MKPLTGQELELSDYTSHLLGAADLRPGHSVVDVGCGTGGPTVAAAERAAPGAVVGVDYVAASVEVATSRIPGDLTNLSFVTADAATYRPASAPIDVVISRFGLMFFPDPPAAFANIAGWLRPGGRLAALVWQPLSRNPWATEINRALTGDDAGTGVDAQSPFSLGDPDDLTGLLTGAGFADVSIESARERVHLGATLLDAMDFVLGFRSSQQALAAMTTREADEARHSLSRTLASQVREDGRVSLLSAAWLVRAQRPGPQPA